MWFSFSEINDSRIVNGDNGVQYTVRKDSEVKVDSPCHLKIHGVVSRWFVSGRLEDLRLGLWKDINVLTHLGRTFELFKSREYCQELVTTPVDHVYEVGGEGTRLLGPFSQVKDPSWRLWLGSKGGSVRVTMCNNRRKGEKTREEEGNEDEIASGCLCNEKSPRRKTLWVWFR